MRFLLLCALQLLVYNFRISDELSINLLPFVSQTWKVLRLFFLIFSSLTSRKLFPSLKINFTRGKSKPQTSFLIHLHHFIGSNHSLLRKLWIFQIFLLSNIKMFCSWENFINYWQILIFINKNLNKQRNVTCMNTNIYSIDLFNNWSIDKRQLLKIIWHN